MARKPSTSCRYCGEGGELYKGAHPQCKADATRQSIRDARGVDPARYTHASDRQTKCSSCPAPRDGMSQWCAACVELRKKERSRKFMAKYRANLRKREVRVEKHVPLPCKCGCGRMAGYRLKYASPECRPKRKPTPKPPPAPKPRTWNQRPATETPPSRTTKMPDKYIGTQTAQTAVVVNTEVKITKLPSFLPASLYETDAERDVRLEELRACGWRGQWTESLRQNNR